VVVKLRPLLRPFLKTPIMQVKNFAIVANSLESPLPREVVVGVAKCGSSGDSQQRADPREFFAVLEDRQRVRRGAAVPGTGVNASEMGQAMRHLLRRLMSDGMTTGVEDKLILMKDNLLKQAVNNAASNKKREGDELSQGVVTLESVTSAHKRDLVQTKDLSGNGDCTQHVHNVLVSVQSQKEFIPSASTSPNATSSSPPSSISQPTSTCPATKSQMPNSKETNSLVTSSSSPGVSTITNEATSSDHKTSTSSVGSESQPREKFSADDADGERSSSPAGTALAKDATPEKKTHVYSLSDSSSTSGGAAQCKVTLDCLLDRKKTEHGARLRPKSAEPTSAPGKSPTPAANVGTYSSPPQGWRPKGRLRTHLHEHDVRERHFRGGHTRILLIGRHSGTSRRPQSAHLRQRLHGRMRASESVSAILKMHFDTNVHSSGTCCAQTTRTPTGWCTAPTARSVSTPANR